MRLLNEKCCTDLLTACASGSTMAQLIGEFVRMQRWGKCEELCTVQSVEAWLKMVWLFVRHADSRCNPLRLSAQPCRWGQVPPPQFQLAMVPTRTRLHRRWCRRWYMRNPVCSMRGSGFAWLRI